jgi:phospholipid transport system substrate-binding protein
METIRSAALLLSLTLGPACLAAQEAPDALLRNATNDYVAGLKEDSELAGDPSRSESLFKARMAPVFDFSRMTQLAMHRNWRLASARQQDRLTAEFKSVLLRAYSAAFASYRDCVITYKASHFDPRDTDATVRSEVKQCAKPHKLDYEMTRTPDGWRVYDIKLDGASIVTAHRGAFAARLHDSGVDGLIRTLAEKNRQSVALANGSM